MMKQRYFITNHIILQKLICDDMLHSDVASSIVRQKRSKYIKTAIKMDRLKSRDVSCYPVYSSTYHVLVFYIC